MTAQDRLAEVLRLAELATPGEWRNGGRTVVADETEDRLGMLVRLHGGSRPDHARNAAFIAAAPPQAAPDGAPK